MDFMKGVITAGILVVLLVAGVRSDLMICEMNVEDMKPCQAAVTDPPAQPDAACCNVLSSANITCFCEYGRDHPMLLKMMGIDPDLARALPAKCQLDSPPDC